ncbi:MAG: hypothetical protein Q7T57_08690 [Dehalococcoidales bacterium]|nr:hypothetical protein [Dehalococcoidales bacterium]
MNEEKRAKEQSGAIRPYMTRAAAIALLTPISLGQASMIDLELMNALKLAIQALRMVEEVHHSVTDPRD